MCMNSEHQIEVARPPSSWIDHSEFQAAEAGTSRWVFFIARLSSSCENGLSCFVTPFTPRGTASLVFAKSLLFFEGPRFSSSGSVTCCDNATLWSQLSKPPEPRAWRVYVPLSTWSRSSGPGPIELFALLLPILFLTLLITLPRLLGILLPIGEY